MNDKPSNPKDLVGGRKPPISTIPVPVLFELGIAMFEGHLKYGGHNWRAIGVRASVYYDACFRHLAAWWAGEDIDPDSGMSHITKAIAGLVILRDAQICGMVNDDRPPKSPADWMTRAKAQALEVLKRYEPVAKPAYTEANRPEWDEDLKLQDKAAEDFGFCPGVIPKLRPYFEDGPLPSFEKFEDVGPSTCAAPPCPSQGRFENCAGDEFTSCKTSERVTFVTDPDNEDMS